MPFGIFPASFIWVRRRGFRRFAGRYHLEPCASHWQGSIRSCSSQDGFAILSNYLTEVPTVAPPHPAHDVMASELRGFCAKSSAWHPPLVTAHDTDVPHKLRGLVWRRTAQLARYHGCSDGTKSGKGRFEFLLQI